LDNDIAMKYSTLQEATSMGSQECLSLFLLGRKHLDQPFHYHDEYELTLVENAEGMQLVIGDFKTILTCSALILTAPGLPHTWNASSSGSEINGIAVRFSSDLLGERFLGRNQLNKIDQLLRTAKQGLLFSPAALVNIHSRLLMLQEKKGFESYLWLLSILHELSMAAGTKTLSSERFEYNPLPFGNRGIDSAFAYMNANYSRPISLADVARTAHMSRGAFCRYIRKKTGKTYMESLNEIRIGHICHMLVGTSENISEIAYKTGYTNIAHFHRSFKRLKGCTPKEYRENLTGGKN